MPSSHPQIWDLYRNGGSVFRDAVWILNKIFISRDGIEYAHLTSALDTSESKPLALSVIADPRRYVLADGAGDSAV